MNRVTNSFIHSFTADIALHKYTSRRWFWRNVFHCQIMCILLAGVPLFKVLLARIPVPFHESVCRIPRGSSDWYWKQDVRILRGTTGSDIGHAASPYFSCKLLNNRKYWLNKYKHCLDDVSGCTVYCRLKKMNSKFLTDDTILKKEPEKSCGLGQ
jgi:hypothetical protein